MNETELKETLVLLYAEYLTLQNNVQNIGIELEKYIQKLKERKNEQM